MIDAQTLDLRVFEAKAAKAAGLLKAMSNERRLMILCRLGGGELSVGDLQRDVDLSQSALSQHLSVLRAEGLVAARRAGQSVYYRIADSAASRVIETLAAIYCPELLRS
ncbi:MAG: metalloregulator ArsR/SmtB family transcription factor [Pseudomonadota bacterium]